MFLMKKWFLLTMIMLLALTTAACGNTNNEKDSGNKKLKIGVIYLTAEHPYYQAHAKQTQAYAKEKGIELVELDGKADQANMTTQMENLIAQKVDGIIYALLEPKAASADINAAQDAGIPVVTFAIKHDPSIAKAPFVGIPESDAGALGGEEAANVFKKNFPDKAPVLCLIDMVGVKPVNDRLDGFVKGFQKVFPDAKIAGRLDGKGKKDEALNVTEDFLQKNPEANVFYGGNGDMSLGALAALEARGRGTGKTELVVSHDGSEPEVLKIADPNSAMKLAVANKPKELARATIDTLLEIINGKRDIKNTDDVMVNAALIKGSDLAGSKTFLKEEYFSNLLENK
jgi:ABC-type sugar transport system substrate-binding protein